MVTTPAEDYVKPLRFAYDDEARSLVIEWEDGATLPIPFSVLRRQCPCAACAGELGASGRFAHQPQLRPGEDELADISLVGAYGLNIVWADGHNTGIYRFEKLREMGYAAAGGTPTAQS